MEAGQVPKKGPQTFTSHDRVLTAVAASILILTLSIIVVGNRVMDSFNRDAAQAQQVHNIACRLAIEANLQEPEGCP